MPHKLSDECLEVAKAFPGRLVRVFGVPGGVLKCPGMLGVLAGVSMLLEVSGSIFYSIPTNIHGALIKALTFSRRPEGPRCLKYQNVPKLRSF